MTSCMEVRQNTRITSAWTKRPRRNISLTTCTKSWPRNWLLSSLSIYQTEHLNRIETLAVLSTGDAMFAFRRQLAFAIHWLPLNIPNNSRELQSNGMRQRVRLIICADTKWVSLPTGVVASARWCHLVTIVDLMQIVTAWSIKHNQKKRLHLHPQFKWQKSGWKVLICNITRRVQI